VKLKAAQEISRLTQELTKVQDENKKLAESAKAPITPELEKEITELRQFRAKLDVEADPKFKEFDKEISGAHDFIYAQLKKSPSISDAIIDEIKKYGGPEKVKMEKVLDSVNDPMIRRLVESKLAEIEMTHYKKDQAISKAKENIGSYVAEREKQFKEVGQSHNTATQKNLDAVMKQLPWMQPKAVDEKSDENARAATKLHNDYIEKTKKELDFAMQDDSPEMRATLLVGMAQLFRLQAVHEAVSKASAAKDETIKKLTETVERLKNAGKSRLKESEAINGGNPNLQTKPNLLEPAGDALDRLRKEKQKTAAT
jgi:hypothetical protein